MLSRSGLGVLIGSIALGLVGGAARYTEAVAVAAGGIAVMIASFVAVRRAPDLVIVRAGEPARVGRGEELRLRTRVHRLGGPVGDVVEMTDTLGDERVETAASGCGEHLAAEYAITARRRGVVRLGPIRCRRTDALGLMVADHVVAGTTTEILVHPRVLALRGRRLAERFDESESAQRRGSPDPTAGFRSLRPYAPGDDLRTIHWPTTARTGTPMVREYTAPTRPSVAVILLTDVGDYRGTRFEDAADIAASICVTARRDGIEVLLLTASPKVPGSPRPLRSEIEALDLLARCTTTLPDSGIDLGAIAQRLPHATCVFVITGRSEEGLERFSTYGHDVVFVTVADTDGGAARVIGGRAEDIVVPNVEAFARWWNNP